MRASRGHRIPAVVAGMVLLLAAPPAHALLMQVVDDQIIMSGETQHGDFERFKRLLVENEGRITTVVMRDGLGGAAAPTLHIGSAIRRLGLRTAVSGRCFSSCAYIFLGGIERHFSDEQSPFRTYLAFHPGFFNGHTDPALNGTSHVWIRNYTDGRINPQLLERIMLVRRPAGAVYFFDSARLRREDGVSIFACTGYETRRVDDCEKWAGWDSYEQGIVTSRELVKVKGPPPPPTSFVTTAEEPD